MRNFRARAEASKYFAGPHPRVLAHRGSSGTHPENTLIAFEQAVVDGADILETDVHMTADGVIIALHDCTVDRTTDGIGNVHEMPYAQLRQLDAGYRFSADEGKTFPFRRRGLYVPRLEEVLQNFPHKPLTIEIKDDCTELMQRLVDLLNKYGRIREGSVLISGKRGKLVRLLRTLAPEALTGYSRPETVRFMAGALLHLPFLIGASTADAIHFVDRNSWFSMSTHGVVNAAHNLGLEVHCWTVNDEKRMENLLAIGVDGLFTDFPARLRKVVDRGNWKSKPRRK